jgi:hypothetical protein
MYSVILVVSQSETKIACSTRLVLINPLKKKRRPLYLKTQSVPRCKHFHLGYRNQSVYDVSGTSHCSQINTKHINKLWTERTIVEC